MKEFLISSQKVPMLFAQERLSRKAEKEMPRDDGEKWQWLYRFPNGLGASVVCSCPNPLGKRNARTPGCQVVAEVSIIQWSGDRWKPLPETTRRVPETDLEQYLGMIKDIPPEDASRLTRGK